MLSSSSPTSLLPLVLLLLSVCHLSHGFHAPYVTRPLSASSCFQYQPRTSSTPHQMAQRFWLQQQEQQRQQQHQQFLTTSTRLYDASFGPWRDSLDDNNHPDDFDVEAARERLESLVLDGSAGSEQKSGDQDIIADQQQQQQQIFSSSSLPISLPSASRLTQPSSSSYSFASSLDQQQQQHDDNDDDDDIFSFQLPRRRTVLTSIERERREAEIQLLSRLAHGDDVLVEIWALWFQERGPQAAARLVQAEELMTMPLPPPLSSSTQQQQSTQSTSSSSTSNNNNNSPEQQVRFRLAEQVLLGLIQEYGVDWSEPINRLATLYYMQGRFLQAIRLCQLVLSNKPWHFGTLSGIVMVYASLQDSNNARHWAAHRLPTYASLGPNRRRQFWVETAVAQAQQSLLSAERRAQSALGKPDSHHHDAVFAKNQQGQRRNNSNDDHDDDAWQ